MSDLLIDLQISEIDLYAHDGTYVGVVHHEVDEKANDFVIDLAETCFTLESLKEIVTKFEEAVKLMEIKVKLKHAKTPALQHTCANAAKSRTNRNGESSPRSAPFAAPRSTLKFTTP